MITAKEVLNKHIRIQSTDEILVKAILLAMDEYAVIKCGEFSAHKEIILVNNTTPTGIKGFIRQFFYKINKFAKNK
jgi:hypothetical protein